MKKTYVLLLAGYAAINLAACAKTKEQFDFSKKAPDEFAVVRRAPLEMPPDFQQIPTPKPGAPRPQELSAIDMARNAVLGEEARKQIAGQNGVSQGEAVLLQKSGAVNASPAIRAKVDQETAEIIEDETPGIDSLRKMVGQTPAEPATELVDPVAETNRLKRNKAQGKPISTGKTPKIED